MNYKVLVLSILASIVIWAIIIAGLFYAMPDKPISECIETTSYKTGPTMYSRTGVKTYEVR